MKRYPVSGLVVVGLIAGPTLSRAQTTAPTVSLTTTAPTVAAPPPPRPRIVRGIAFTPTTFDTRPVKKVRPPAIESEVRDAFKSFGLGISGAAFDAKREELSARPTVTPDTLLTPVPAPNETDGTPIVQFADSALVTRLTQPPPQPAPGVPHLDMLARWAQSSGAPSFWEPYFIGWRGELWGQGITPALSGARLVVKSDTCGTFVTRLSASAADYFTTPSNMPATKIALPGFVDARQTATAWLLVGATDTNGTLVGGSLSNAIPTVLDPQASPVASPSTVAYTVDVVMTPRQALCSAGWMCKPNQITFGAGKRQGDAHADWFDPTVVEGDDYIGVSTVMVNGFTVRAKVVGVRSWNDDCFERTGVSWDNRCLNWYGASSGFRGAEITQPPSGTSGLIKVHWWHNTYHSIEYLVRFEFLGGTNYVYRKTAAQPKLTQCSGER